jgi:hypothetical protein
VSVLGGKEECAGIDRSLNKASRPTAAFAWRKGWLAVHQTLVSSRAVASVRAQR